MEWVAFLLAALGFAYLPGPAMLYTAAQTLGRGRRAGWLAVTGVHLGCYVHVVAAAFGLALLFAAIPPAYLAMKVIGGIYLLWMGGAYGNKVSGRTLRSYRSRPPDGYCAIAF